MPAHAHQDNAIARLEADQTEDATVSALLAIASAIEHLAEVLDERRHE